MNPKRPDANAMYAAMLERLQRLEAQANRDVERLKQLFIWLVTQDERLKKITISYEGSGDSGSIDSITFSGKDSSDELSQQLHDKLFRLKVPKEIKITSYPTSTYNSDRERWEQTTTPVTDVDDALDKLGWDIPYGLDPGFEINDGAYGTVTVRFNENEDEVIVEVEHNSRYTAVNTWEYNL